MSLKTWMEEFYPIEADELAEGGATETALIEHSLKKWLGLRPKSLAEHHVFLTDTQELVNEDQEDYEGRLGIDSTTCALCARHLYAEKADFGTDCGSCHLYIVRGGTPCDRPRTSEDYSPYREFCDNNNPDKMIYWLRRALKAAKP